MTKLFISYGTEYWQAMSHVIVCLPSNNHPYCLAHKSEGHSVSFTVPSYCDMKGMTLCGVYLSTSEII